MYDVVSLGSINVDRVAYASREEIETLAARHDWFPAAGETVRIDAVHDALVGHDFRNFLGGKGANQAGAAARAGAETGLFGTVGADEGRYAVRETLSARGVDTAHVATRGRYTGTAYIFVDEAGENWIAILEGANGHTDAAYVERQLDRIAAADVLLLQNEIPTAAMTTVLDALTTRSNRPTVVFNPAPTDGSEAVLRCESVDVVTVNQGEYAHLESILDEFDGTVVVTQGGDGVVVDGASRVIPPPVEPVDTTGAGDVFVGYLGARLAAGDDVLGAVETATIAASLSTESKGAQEAIPRLEAVERFAARASSSGR